MTWDQVVGPLRAILPAFLAFAIAKGWIPAGSADWIGASIITVGAAIWSVWSNRPAAVAAQAQAIPGVTVTTSPAAPAAVTEAVKAAKT